MKISVNVSGIDAIRSQFAKLGNLPQLALDKTAIEVEDFIGAQIGKHAKTGALERSLGKVRIPNGWEIWNDSRVAPYALFVHDGTKAHAIFPKKKKALRWASGGVFHFSKKGVHHPGNKPDKWIDRAAAAAPDMFRAHLDQLLKA